MAHEYEGNMVNEFDADPEQILEALGSALDVVEKIETISTTLGNDTDQSVRNIVRIITEHGGDYAKTEFGDMTVPLLNDFHKILVSVTAQKQ